VACVTNFLFMLEELYLTDETCKICTCRFDISRTLLHTHKLETKTERVCEKPTGYHIRRKPFAVGSSLRNICENA